jgi:hypothetical protein
MLDKVGGGGGQLQNALVFPNCPDHSGDRLEEQSICASAYSVSFLFVCGWWYMICHIVSVGGG